MMAKKYAKKYAANQLALSGGIIIQMMNGNVMIGF
jgi:hypothetical protein